MRTKRAFISRDYNDFTVKVAVEVRSLPKTYTRQEHLNGSNRLESRILEVMGSDGTCDHLNRIERK